MSVLIKGMEMPKAGDWKTIRIYYDGTCAVPNWQGDCKYMQGCEAVPVPPHGRLGDLDELEKTFREDADFEWNRFASPANWADAFDDVADMIADAPTIIEAEDNNGADGE